MKLVSVIFIYSSLILAFFSCTKDKVMEVDNICSETITYVDHIRPIMDSSCAYSGCHVGGGAPGDFSNYSGISNFIDGGLIASRVTVDRSMPPNYATQGPTELDEEEINLFKCWVEAGYPEN